MVTLLHNLRTSKPGRNLEASDKTEAGTADATYQLLQPASVRAGLKLGPAGPKPFPVGPLGVPFCWLIE
jgi:hypothetical protein